MTTTNGSERTTKILVGYDGSDCAVDAIKDLAHAGLPTTGTAIVLAAASSSAVPAVAYSPASAALSEVSWVAPSTWQEMVDEATKETMDTASAGAALARSLLPHWEIQGDHSLDSPYRGIVDQAEKHGVSLIVVGSHGRSTLGRMLLGSTSQFVLGHAQCSVRVGRRSRTAPGSPLRIVVGVDGSVGSFAAIHEVTRRHWPEGTAFRVLASVDLRLSAALAGHAAAAWADSRYLRHDPQAATPTQIVQAASELLREAGLSAVQVVEEGDPKITVVEHAERWGADAIFLGATGLSRTQRFFLGSVSNTIAARAHCSVEVVRSLEGMANVVRSVE